MERQTSLLSGAGGRAFSNLRPADHLDTLKALDFGCTTLKSHQWSLNWTNSTDAVMTTPMRGGFANGQGQFLDQEEFREVQLLVRNGFSAIKRDSSRFEQAFSDDGGRAWETIGS